MAKGAAEDPNGLFLFVQRTRPGVDPVMISPRMRTNPLPPPRRLLPTSKCPDFLGFLSFSDANGSQISQ